MLLGTMENSSEKVEDLQEFPSVESETQALPMHYGIPRIHAERISKLFIQWNDQTIRICSECP